MAETDVAVRRDGKTLRLVTDNALAGLFDKTGLIETLVVTAPATAYGRMPELETMDGEAVQLSRGSKPCSCTGAPWNLSVQSLRDAF